MSLYLLFYYLFIFFYMLYMYLYRFLLVYILLNYYDKKYLLWCKYVRCTFFSPVTRLLLRRNATGRFISLLLLFQVFLLLQILSISLRNCSCLNYAHCSFLFSYLFQWTWLLNTLGIISSFFSLLVTKQSST